MAEGQLQLASVLRVSHVLKARAKRPLSIVFYLLFAEIISIGQELIISRIISYIIL